MNLIDALNNVINYIEDNLEDEIDFYQVAKIACCSPYHFQRMFVYMTNVSLSEYIRRRKMSQAAIDLRDGNEKILDVGLRYGYSSPTAFNRAFQSVHGIAPSRAREDGVSIKSYLPLNFKITIKGVEELKYRIEAKEEMRIVGISMPISKVVEENFEEVPDMWSKANTDGTITKLCQYINAEPTGVLGVSIMKSDDDFRYYIAVSSTKEIEDTIFEECIIPATTWAIFSGEGTGKSIQELGKSIYSEWLPSSGYDYGNSADIEVYFDPDPQNTKYEVWIPVVKK